MNSISYREANLVAQEQKRKVLRQEILAADDQQSLELILDAPRPSTLVQSFPDQDLHYLMHKIGADDFIPILAMAKSDQWEYILDVEVWEDDRLNTPMMARNFALLFQAAPERFLRWIIMEKPGYFEFFLSKHMVIHLREHDAIPPEDFDDYITLDDTFYFRFPNVADNVLPDDSEQDFSALESEKQLGTGDMIKNMMNKLAGMDLSVYHGLLMETQALLPAEIEEEEFRLKTVRLAEKGFLPAHEAIGIYQSVDVNKLRKRPSLKNRESTEKYPIVPPDFYNQFLNKKNPFVKALSLLSAQERTNLESEIAALINKVISADRIRIRTKENLEKTIQKTSDYLGLGLEILEKNTNISKTLPELLHTYFIEDIFRIGARQALNLKTRAERIFQNSFITQSDLPLGFWGEKFMGILGGLLIERPMFFDNYKTKVLYRDFSKLDEIRQTNEALDQIQAMDEFIARIKPDFSSFSQGVLTYESVILTLWAKNSLNMASDLSGIPISVFRKFFEAMFSEYSKNTPETQDIRLEDMKLWAAKFTEQETYKIPESLINVFSNLLENISQEYCEVSPNQIDSRFIPHFLLQ